MKYLKTKKQYKASNVILNLDPLEATSYNWWIFLKRIKGKLVFNNYRYSVSTCKHQSKVLSKLRELGIKIDYYIESPKGLQDLDSAIKYYESEIASIKTDLVVSNRRQKTKLNQLETIKSYESILKVIQKLR